MDTDRADVAPLLAFEVAAPLAEGAWGGGPPETLAVDADVVHRGAAAGRLTRGPESPGQFSAMAVVLPADFDGERVELSGWLRLDDVVGLAGLWQRQDGADGVVQFDNMADRGLRGTTGWRRYTIELPLDPGAREIVIGALLSGTGTVWVDDLELRVDGRPLATLPVAALEALPPEPAPDTAPLDLTDEDVEALVLLGKVWGFVKYHHPAIAGADGADADAALLEVLPTVLAATDPEGARAAVDAWVEGLGELGPCDPCLTLPDDVVRRPRLAWSSDPDRLGAALAERLPRIHAARVRADHYLRLDPSVGNPDFSMESAAPAAPLPDLPHRLLAVFRLWNIVEYAAPYRDDIDEDWDAVLGEAVRAVAAADDEASWVRAMLALVAHLHDTHANLWGSLEHRPPVGDAGLPVESRFVGDEPVVVRSALDALRPGDVITALDGVSVADRLAEWRPLYAVSNEAALRRDVAATLTRGPAGPVTVDVRRGSEALSLALERGRDTIPGPAFHDHPGPPFRRLSDEVAYLTLSSVDARRARSYVRAARGAACLVIDLRNYPSDFVPFALGGHLVGEATPFAKFTTPDPSNPGAFVWSDAAVLAPRRPTFDGRVVILVDETTQSQAEYTAMALRVAPGARVVGSTTAGADGNISPIPLPGGLRAMISGIGVYYPDGTPTQRVGIVPDLVVTPTVDGLRDGRDEVLDAAVRAVLGRPLTEAERDALRGDAARGG